VNSRTTLKFTSASSSARPDLAHRAVHVGLVSVPRWTDVGEGLLELLGEGVEHCLRV
jgi:hypothetical protein